MPSYKAPLDHIRFILTDVLDAGRLSAFDGYSDATLDVIDAVLEEGARLAETELQPLNLSGDTEGCHFDSGVVTTPKGFKEAYTLFCEGGWVGLTADTAYGGQGMPHYVGAVLNEIICSANMSFGMYAGLSHGAYDALKLHGSEAQKAVFLPKLTSGIWSGTMNLTEPHCGTDLGLIRSKAEVSDVNDPELGEAYRISGSKIYISAGEHDLTENIIHLVLARLPNAPEGVKGISLFVVPKFLSKKYGDDWTIGDRNAVTCGSIEHKMGIKASSTCVMNYDGAIGWLVGEPHKGLKAMFTMMNAARLGVGLQGLGSAEVALQNAATFARERLQGRSLSGAKYPDKAADPIIVHPDVRRMLLTMKAQTEGARALAIWVAMSLDEAAKHPDKNARLAADDLAALMTPIVKAYMTDMGFEAANLAVQVYGGHGFIKDYGVEQFVRDARITQIYEGTNGIQALDLVGRKLPLGMGRLLRRFFHPASELLAELQDVADFQTEVFSFAKAFAKLQQATATIAQKGLKDPEEAAAAATDYLRIFALVAVGFMWLKMLKAARDKLAEGGEVLDLAKADFYKDRLKLGRFYFEKLMPEVSSRFVSLMAGKATLMDFNDERF